MNTQATKDLATNALTALTLAQDALEQAKGLLKAAGVDDPTISLANAVAAAQGTTSGKRTTSSGGRLPSAEQVQIREAITKWCTGADAGLFTVNMMTKILGKDKIQVRNAINALTDVVVVRFAEKFQTSPGAREIIYKPVDFDAGV